MHGRIRGLPPKDKKKAECLCYDGIPLSFFMPVGALLAVFGLLAGRPAAMRSSDILFLFGFGLNLAAAVFVFLLCRAEHYAAAGDYVVNVCHTYKNKEVRRRESEEVKKHCNKQYHSFTFSLSQFSD